MSEEITADNLFTWLSKWGETRKYARLYFRGEKAVNGNLDFPLQPSLVRNSTYLRLARAWSEWKSPKDLEDALIRRYTRYTAHHIETDCEFAGRTLKQLEILCLAQHYGLPTLLTDWSLNALTGLYFALAKDDTGDLVNGPGRLWVMELKPSRKREKLTIHLEDPLTHQQIENIVKNAIAKKSPMIVVPLVFTKRIAAQEGRFVYSPHAKNSGYALTSEKGNVPWATLTPYEIPGDSNAKQALLDVINSLGFHAGRLFPDLTGWAKYLRQGNK
jgi:hypothetical protein